VQNILVCGQDRLAGEIISAALRQVGHSVECVVSETGAYKRLASIPTIDALVLDFRQDAGATVYDIARFARGVIPSVAVVYVSEAAERGAFEMYGVARSEFVAKRFEAAELAEAVNRLLRPRRASA